MLPPSKKYAFTRRVGRIGEERVLRGATQRRAPCHPSVHPSIHPSPLEPSTGCSLGDGGRLRQTSWKRAWVRAAARCPVAAPSQATRGHKHPPLRPAAWPKAIPLNITSTTLLRFMVTPAVHHAPPLILAAVSSPAPHVALGRWDSCMAGRASQSCLWRHSPSEPWHAPALPSSRQSTLA